MKKIAADRNYRLRKSAQEVSMYGQALRWHEELKQHRDSLLKHDQWPLDTLLEAEHTDLHESAVQISKIVSDYMIRLRDLGL